MTNERAARGSGSTSRWDDGARPGERQAVNRPAARGRATRRGTVGALLALGGSLALATAVSPASAAVPISPRPAPVPPPADRVVEMVSPVDTAGQPVDHVLQVAADESGGVLFQSLGAFGDVQNSNGPTFYRARRGATGWETTGMQPRPIETIPSSRTTPTFAAADAQLESLIATSALGALGSVPLCPEPQAAAGTCDASSRIGAVTVEAGTGPAPYALDGQGFVGGPYRGAPFSLSFVVPAKARFTPKTGEPRTVTRTVTVKPASRR